MTIKQIQTWIIIFCSCSFTLSAGDPVSLVVREESGFDRNNEWVRSGVPFSVGQFPKGQQFSVMDGQGNILPLYCKETSHWPDGSIRWLLLNFPLSLRAFSDKTLTLKPTSFSLKGEPLAAIKDGICHVKTRTLEFDIHSQGTLFSNFKFRQKEIALLTTDIVLTDVYKNPYRLSAGHRDIVLEETSPFNAIVKVSGTHFSSWQAPLFDFVLRVYVSKLSSQIRIDYTLKNRQKAEFCPLRSVFLQLCFQKDWSRYYLGNSDGYYESGFLTENGKAVYECLGPTNWQQNRKFIQTIHLPNKPVRNLHKRSNGWAAIGNHDVSITTAVKNMWQEHPKGYTLEPNRLAVDLWPDRTEYLVFPRGAEKTTTMIFSIDSVPDRNLATTIQHPLFAVASPSQYCSSGALELLSPIDTTTFGDYEQVMDILYNQFIQSVKENKEWGMLDYGDNTQFPQFWSNCEYDTPHGFLLYFARSGNLEFLDRAKDAALHMADMDVIHYWPERPEVVGGMHKHDIAHTGHRHAGEMQRHLDHIWTEGICETFLLTGNYRLKDAAIELGDHLAREAGIVGVRSNNERNYGWPMIGLLGVYKAVDDIKYLQAAEMVWSQVVKKMHPKRGLWLREWGHDPDGNLLLGNKIFMAAVLMTGAQKLYEVTRDEQILDFLEKSSYTIIREGWVKESKGFYYTPSWEDRFVGRLLDTRELVPLGFTFLETGEKEFYEIGKEQFDALVAELLRTPINLSTKEFSIFARTLPHFQAVIAKKDKD